MKNAKGSRVQSVMILCSKCKVPEYEPIDSTQHYTLITTKYLTNGGDKYIMIRDGIIDSADYGKYRLSRGVFDMYERAIYFLP